MIHCLHEKFLPLLVLSIHCSVCSSPGCPGLTSADMALLSLSFFPSSFRCCVILLPFLCAIVRVHMFSRKPWCRWVSCGKLVEVDRRLRSAHCLHYQEDRPLYFLLPPWQWRQEADLKHRLISIRLYSTTSQKTFVFILAAGEPDISALLWVRVVACIDRASLFGVCTPL
jgi:hypothetical protein